MRLLLTILLLAAGLVALTPRHLASRERGTETVAVFSSTTSNSSAPPKHRASISSRLQRTEGTVRSNINTSSAGIDSGMGDGMAEADRDSEAQTDEPQVVDDEIPGILAGLVARNDPAEDALKYRLMERWAKVGPEALAQWASALSVEQGRGRILRQALLNWADSDLEAAIAFAQGEQAGASRSELLLGLAYESLQQDARRGLELAADLPATTERDELLEKGVMEWAASDPDPVTKWVHEVADLQLREKLIAAAAIGMAENQGYEAATLAANSIQSIPERDRAIVSILQRWVQSAPASALEWLVRFPDGDLKKSATQSTVATWGARDPEAARGWVNALPPSPLKEWASLAIHP